MPLAGPSQGERLLRIAEGITALVPLPYLDTVIPIIKEIYGIVQRVKSIKPACEGLINDAIIIANALADHYSTHPGDSKLEGAKSTLIRIVKSIKLDVSCWANFGLWMIVWKTEEILDKIESHRLELQGAITHLMLGAALSQEVEGARRDREIQIVRRNTEEILKRVEEGARETAAVKEAYRKAKLHTSDIEIEEDAENRILKLRLNEAPNFFPSEDMNGEVRKEGLEAFCHGTTFAVFKAIWVDRGCVAAKRFIYRDWELSEKEKRRFKRQVNIWRTLKHPNIVPLLGVCEFQPKRPPYLISPWMKYGNVRHYLKNFTGADKLKLIGLSFHKRVACLIMKMSRSMKSPSVCNIFMASEYSTEI